MDPGERPITLKDAAAALGVPRRELEERLAYSIYEVARMLGVDVRAVKERIKRDGIPYFWFGKKQMLRKEVVEAILAGEATRSIEALLDKPREEDGRWARARDEAEIPTAVGR